MSLARACLRLSAVAALRGQTLAGAAVFDSRIGAVDGLRPQERRPVIAVYTEDQSGEALSSQNGGPPFKPLVELVFELTMVEAQFDEATQIENIACPTTDNELEASLDTLEQQIVTTLFENMTLPLSVLFRKIAVRAHHYQSLRFREEQKGIRLAYRYIIIKIEVFDEPILVAYDGKLTGLDLLPRPFREIAKAWPDDLPEKAVALAMAQAFAQPTLTHDLAIAAQVKVGPILVASSAPASSNVGNGNLAVEGVDPEARPGNTIVKFTSATTFDVFGPGLRRQRPGLVGTTYRDLVHFAITVGATAFVPGDSFTIVVAAGGVETTLPGQTPTRERQPCAP